MNDCILTVNIFQVSMQNFFYVYHLAMAGIRNKEILMMTTEHYLHFVHPDTYLDMYVYNFSERNIKMESFIEKTESCIGPSGT